MRYKMMIQNLLKLLSAKVTLEGIFLFTRRGGWNNTDCYCLRGTLPVLALELLKEIGQLDE
jgi:hypothetical protein